MPRVSQTHAEIKHLVLLRKALAEKLFIEVYAREPSVRLLVGDGYFHGAEAVESIRRMIEMPVLLFDWEMIQRKGFFIAQNPKEIFARAVSEIRPDAQRLSIYGQLFSKLPPIRMRLNPTFHFDSGLHVEYQSLYRLSLAADGASVAAYLQASKDEEQLRRRIGIVIAGYCVGDFVPVSKPAVKAEQGRNMVSRILARFRRAEATS